MNLENPCLTEVVKQYGERPADFMASLRPCVTCHFCSGGAFDNAKYLHCRHPGLDTVYDVVTGRRVPRDCNAMRRNKDFCGREGKLWVEYVPWRSRVWTQLMERIRWT